MNAVQRKVRIVKNWTLSSYGMPSLRQFCSDKLKLSIHTCARAQGTFGTIRHAVKWSAYVNYKQSCVCLRVFVARQGQSLGWVCSRLQCALPPSQHCLPLCRATCLESTCRSCCLLLRGNSISQAYASLGVASNSSLRVAFVAHYGVARSIAPSVVSANSKHSNTSIPLSFSLPVWSRTPHASCGLLVAILSPSSRAQIVATDRTYLNLISWSTGRLVSGDQSTRANALIGSSARFFIPSTGSSTKLHIAKVQVKCLTKCLRQSMVRVWCPRDRHLASTASRPPFSYWSHPTWASLV